jgi:hypothetical protein
MNIMTETKKKFFSTELDSGVGPGIQAGTEETDSHRLVFIHKYLFCCWPRLSEFNIYP